MALRLIIWCLALLAATPALAESRRIAVVLGNNAGDGTLAPLRYAESDAGKVARLLVELGDVNAEDLFLLQGRGLKDVEGTLSRVKEYVAGYQRSPETRTLLLFYFSGHSDGEALELGRERLSYSALKSMLKGTGADVRVTIVDACRSGSSLREKGGKPAEPFVIKLTENLNAQGEAFISSSAADEAALESSEVMGSIFTHNLVSGLRGAADVSGDRLVTLAEAYRYAHDQTVSRTAMLPVGAQHPSYDYQLSGQGELVLTSLAKASGVLVMPEGTERAIITDVGRDQVVAELPSAATRDVAVQPGQYGVRIYLGGKSFGGRVAVAEGGRRQVRLDELSPLSNSTAVAAKGGSVRLTLEPEETWTAKRVATVSLGATPPVAQDLGLKGVLRLGFEPRAGLGPSFAVLGSFGQGGAASESGVEGRAGFRFAWQLSQVWLSAGAELGAAWLWQSSPVGVLSSGALVVAPRISARVGVAGPFSITLDIDAAVLAAVVDGRMTPLFRPQALLGAAFLF